MIDNKCFYDNIQAITELVGRIDCLERARSRNKKDMKLVPMEDILIERLETSIYCLINLWKMKS
jgi:hypothetical protein